MFNNPKGFNNWHFGRIFFICGRAWEISEKEFYISVLGAYLFICGCARESLLILDSFCLLVVIKYKND